MDKEFKNNPLFQIFKQNPSGVITEEIEDSSKFPILFDYLKDNTINLNNKIKVIDMLNEIIKINDIKTNEKYNKIFLNEINLCNEFKNNFVLVKKGKCDIITDGIELYLVKNKGSLKRTGGIGDILSGLINCYC